MRSTYYPRVLFISTYKQFLLYICTYVCMYIHMCVHRRSQLQTGMPSNGAHSSVADLRGVWGVPWNPP